MNVIKQQFPIFTQHKNLVYLDNAASTQTPQVVIDAMNEYYTQYRSNIHRGLYDLSAMATEKYEAARKKIANFIGAEEKEIIFTSGATHGLNFLASSLGKNLKKGDNIVLTQLEHHANLVPWQMIAKQTGAELRFIKLNLNVASTPPLARGGADGLIDENTKIVSFSLVSNVLGTIAPAKEIIVLAKSVGATTAVDAAQAVAHLPIDVEDVGCDFLVFSGHKMYGPTGIGIIYGKKERLQNLEPYFYGGDMIKEVTYENSTWADIPERFEGGTPNIAGAIGLGAAVDFLQSIGWEKIWEQEHQLTNNLIIKLSQLEGINIIGPTGSDHHLGVVSFTLNGTHPHDIAEILNRDLIAVRAGHHCCMPLMKLLGIPGTVRASIGVYNTEEDVHRLMDGIKNVKSIFNK